VLAVAAVAGQRFDFTLLQHLTQRDETALLGLIKELMAHRLVVEESADRFAFRHALTREAVYAIIAGLAELVFAVRLQRLRRGVSQTVSQLTHSA